MKTAAARKYDVSSMPDRDRARLIGALGGVSATIGMARFPWTSTKKMETALRKSEAQLQAILDDLYAQCPKPPAPEGVP